MLVFVLMITLSLAACGTKNTNTPTPPAGSNSTSSQSSSGNDKSTEAQPGTGAQDAAKVGDAASVGWPSVWPADLPKLDGSVAHSVGTSLTENDSVAVTVVVSSSDVVKTYIDSLVSSGWKKLSEMSSGNNISTTLQNSAYTMSVEYNANNNNCALTVKLNAKAPETPATPGNPTTGKQ